LGERAHLLTRDTGLDTHIDDIVNVFKFEELHGVILVGHSYGGIVVTGVADRLTGRIRGLFYIDAHVPDDGIDLVSLWPPDRRAYMFKAIEERGDGWRVPVFPAKAFGALRDEDAEWIDGLCVDQPFKTVTAPLRHGDPTSKIGNLTYIRAAGYANESFEAFYRRFAADPRWHTEKLPCGHDVMVDMPERLAELLIEAAAR
jgi:pimeloyl-ACP methyl ester carboxylesterase